MILALDLAQNLGWAAGAKFGRPSCGTFVLAGGVTDPGEGFAAGCDAIADLITLHQPKTIVAERFVPPHRQKRADIGYWLIGLVAVAQLVACKREVPLRLISAATARADILSNGHANKDDVIAWTIQQGWAPRDDHQADALLLLAHAHGMRAERRRKAA